MNDKYKGKLGELENVDISAESIIKIFDSYKLHVPAVWNKQSKLWCHPPTHLWTRVVNIVLTYLGYEASYSSAFMKHHSTQRGQLSDSYDNPNFNIVDYWLIRSKRNNIHESEIYYDIFTLISNITCAFNNIYNVRHGAYCASIPDGYVVPLLDKVVICLGENIHLAKMHKKFGCYARLGISAELQDDIKYHKHTINSKQGTYGIALSDPIHLSERIIMNHSIWHEIFESIEQYTGFIRMIYHCIFDDALLFTDDWHIVANKDVQRVIIDILQILFHGCMFINNNRSSFYKCCVNPIKRSRVGKYYVLMNVVEGIINHKPFGEYYICNSSYDMPTIYMGSHSLYYRVQDDDIPTFEHIETRRVIQKNNMIFSKEDLTCAATVLFWDIMSIQK